MRMLTVHADLKILKTNYFSHVYKAKDRCLVLVNYKTCHLTGSLFPTSNITPRLEPVYLTLYFYYKFRWGKTSNFYFCRPSAMRYVYLFEYDLDSRAGFQMFRYKNEADIAYWPACIRRYGHRSVSLSYRYSILYARSSNMSNGEYIWTLMQNI